jgi:hypothetical protein
MLQIAANQDITRVVPVFLLQETRRLICREDISSFNLWALAAPVLLSLEMT